MKPLNIFLSTLTLTGLLVAGCGPSLIEDEIIDREAEIIDTPENRQIVNTVEQYRQALVQRDIGTLRSMVSESYYENASSTDSNKDDYGSEYFDELLAILSEHVLEVHYDIRIMEIELVGDLARVRYVFNARYRYSVAGIERWSAEEDVNQLTLRREQHGWKITEGM